MRLYSFVNYYLSDLQRGLQTAHVVGEMSRKYFIDRRDRDELELIDLKKWLITSPTIIILNGGNHLDLLELNEHLQVAEMADELVFPFAMFREDFNSLREAITAVGVLLPEEWWTVAGRQQHFGKNKNTDYLIRKLNNSVLA